jgi:hypothetical protein
MRFEKVEKMVELINRGSSVYKAGSLTDETITGSVYTLFPRKKSSDRNSVMFSIDLRRDIKDLQQENTHTQTDTKQKRIMRTKICKQREMVDVLI